MDKELIAKNSDTPLYFYEKNRFSHNIRYLNNEKLSLILNAIIRYSNKSVEPDPEGFVLDLDIIKPKLFRKIADLAER